DEGEERPHVTAVVDACDERERAEEDEDAEQHPDGDQQGDEARRDHHRHGNETVPSETRTRPSRASDSTTAGSSSATGLSAPATRRSTAARCCRKEPSNGPCLRSGS